MRILYTFRFNDGFWNVKCPSDTSIPESKFNSLHEAINNFIDSHTDLIALDIVVPISISKPIKHLLSKRTVIESHTIEHTVFSKWGNKPIPNSTIEFKYHKKWVVAVPPYKPDNVYYFKYPLPDTLIMTIIRGVGTKPVWIINGTLKRKYIVIELDDCTARIYKDWGKIKIAFTESS